MDIEHSRQDYILVMGILRFALEQWGGRFTI